MDLVEGTDRIKMKKIIETALPLKKLNASSIGDKVKKGHPGNLHLWWNRSPIDSSTALLKAAMEDDPDGREQAEYVRKNQFDDLKNIAVGTENGYLPSGQDYPVICDPFTGFGGLTIAAQRLGLTVQAGDLNSVAALLTKAVSEIPSKFVDSWAINPEAENRLYFGSEGFAADVDYYGQQIKETAYKKLSTNCITTTWAMRICRIIFISG